jgi:hypothetical protein
MNMLLSRLANAWAFELITSGYEDSGSQSSRGSLLGIGPLNRRGATPTTRAATPLSLTSLPKAFATRPNRFAANE